MLMDENTKEQQLRLACRFVEKLASEGGQWTLDQALAKFPELRNDLDAQVELVYSEFSWREEMGSTNTVEEWHARYPKLGSRLTRLLEIHELLNEDEKVHRADLQASSPPTAPIPGQAEVDSIPVGVPAFVTHRSHAVLSRSYEILAQLGEGSSSIVYQARHRRLGRMVALKAMKNAMPAAEERDRFNAEATAFAKLHHPNIVQIYEIGSLDQSDYIAMEYVGNGTLKDTIARDNSPRRIAEIMCQLADAIATVHRAGIIHRDLKPANILMDPDGIPKIADFGLAKQTKDAAEFLAMTGSCVLVGTPAYMSPEQVQGVGAKLGPSVDIFALGIIHYELLTGRRPFESTTALDTLFAINSKQPVIPSMIKSSVPRDLETICLKCLEKTPGDRYTTADELREDLQRYLDHRPILARRATWLILGARWFSQHTSLVLGSVLAALVLFILLSYERIQFSRLQFAEKNIQKEYRLNGSQRVRALKAEQAFEESLEKTREIMVRWSTLGDQLYESQGLSEIGKTQLEDAVRYYQEIIEDNAGEQSLYFDAATAMMRAGILHYQLGRWHESLAGLRRAKHLLAQLPNNPDVLSLEAECELQMGHVALRMERPSEAKQAFDSARSVLERLNREDATELKHATRLANAIACLSKLEASKSKWAECLHLYLYSLAVQQTAFRHSLGLPEDERWGSSKQWTTENEISLSEQCIQESKLIYESLVVNPLATLSLSQNAHYLEGMAFSLDGMGTSLMSLKQLNLSDQAFRVALQFRQLNQQSNLKDHNRIRYLAQSQHRLGLLLSRKYLGNDAITCYQSSSELMKQLCEKFPDRVDFRIDFGDMRCEYAKGLRDISLYSESVAAADEAIAIYEPLVTQFKNDIFLKRKLSKSIETKGMAYYCMAMYPEACREFERAITNMPTAAVLNNQAWTLCHANRGDPALALQWAEQAYAMDSNPRILNTIAFAHFRLGHLEKARQIQSELIQRDPPIRSSDALIMALIEAREGKVAESEQWFAQAVAIRMQEAPAKQPPFQLEKDIRREILECLPRNTAESNAAPLLGP